MQTEIEEIEKERESLKNRVTQMQGVIESNERMTRERVEIVVKEKDAEIQKIVSERESLRN